MISREEADEKIKQGWLRALVIFEVVAVNEEATKKAIELHLKKLENDERVKVYKKDLSEIVKVEKPTPRVDVGYSVHSEVEIIASSLDKLMQITIEYGPSAIELLEPKKMEVPLNDAQGMLNSVSQVMHQFAAAGVGGFVLVSGKQK